MVNPKVRKTRVSSCCRRFLHRPALHGTMDSGRRTYHLRNCHLRGKDTALPAGTFGRSESRRTELPGRQARDEVNKMAELGTQLAHVDGGVPNMRIVIPALNEESIGGLLYFFEIACGISGYILGVNPFNQPGVEAYKKNMFALLNKPGYEEESKAIQARL